jgi:hypothetical protein
MRQKTYGRHMGTSKKVWMVTKKHQTVKQEEPVYTHAKEKTTSSLRAIDVGALTTLQTSVCTERRKVMVVHMDWLAPYQGEQP